MSKPPFIRVIAICVFRIAERILVFEAFDSVKETPFYRPLGGGVEPGETTRELPLGELDPRSLAVDRLLHTFGTPIHVAAPGLIAFGGKPFARLMIAQDTGSAIVGPARGDLFFGSGDRAGEMAGGVRHAAQFYALLPRRLAEEAA